MPLLDNRRGLFALREVLNLLEDHRDGLEGRDLRDLFARNVGLHHVAPDRRDVRAESGHRLRDDLGVLAREQRDLDGVDARQSLHRVRQRDAAKVRRNSERGMVGLEEEHAGLPLDRREGSRGQADDEASDRHALHDGAPACFDALLEPVERAVGERRRIDLQQEILGRLSVKLDGRSQFLRNVRESTACVERADGQVHDPLGVPVRFVHLPIEGASAVLPLVVGPGVQRRLLDGVLFRRGGESLGSADRVRDDSCEGSRRRQQHQARDGCGQRQASPASEKTNAHILLLLLG